MGIERAAWLGNDHKKPQKKLQNNERKLTGIYEKKNVFRAKFLNGILIK